MSHNKKHRCGCDHAKAYCSKHSKIKMKFMMQRNQNTVQDTFYSFFKEERKPITEIIAGMHRRLKDTYTNYNWIIFYDNQSYNAPALAKYSPHDKA